MACAPHLSFLVLVFSFIIVCITCPSGGSICCVFVVFMSCANCMFLWGVCGCECGNSIWACCSALLMVFGACVYMVRNSSCVSMALLVLF